MNKKQNKMEDIRELGVMGITIGHLLISSLVFIHYIPKLMLIIKCYNPILKLSIVNILGLGIGQSVLIFITLVTLLSLGVFVERND